MTRALARASGGGVSTSLPCLSQCSRLLVPAECGERIRVWAVLTAWALVVSCVFFPMVISCATAGRHRARNRPASCSCTGPARLTRAAVAGFRSGGVGPTSLWWTWCRTTTCRCTAFMRVPLVSVVKVGTGVGGEALFPLTVLLMLEVAMRIVVR